MFVPLRVKHTAEILYSINELKLGQNLNAIIRSRETCRTLLHVSITQQLHYRMSWKKITLRCVCSYQWNNSTIRLLA